ncbi:hypothetical protein, partial [Enterococcus entomosocium]|uniref:hypothetical protein n=1 Tax=Enterococcus entomosocium TaxID=3034352 RepID=UPI0026486159
NSRRCENLGFLFLEDSCILIKNENIRNRILICIKIASKVTEFIFTIKKHLARSNAKRNARK